jgi:FkbM family methyltransferase
MDVGVRGGIANHWLNFGDHLHAWGFDVLYESVGPLIEANEHPERLHYLNIGLGDQDTTRAFRFYPDNPSSSHFAASNGTNQLDESWQNVPIRRLDSLYADGTIGPIDFMKVDAESYEIEIVKGAREFFRNSGIFGMESETTFQRTPAHPRSHFVELYEELAPYEFSVCDAGLQRVPRRPLAGGFPNETAPGEYELQPIGAPWVFDFLFLNDIFDNTGKQATASIDRLLKMIAVAEIYTLQDFGLDILFSNRDRLGGRFDVEQGADWLVRQRPATKLTYQQYLAAVTGFPQAKPGGDDPLSKSKFAGPEALLAQTKRRLTETEAELEEIRASRSWRLTAPIRKAANWLRARKG